MASSSSSDDDDDIEREAATAEVPLLSEWRDGPHSDEPGSLYGYRQNVVILCLAIVLLISLGAGVLTPPLNALLEDIICRQYHPEVAAGPGVLSNDPMCKYPDVQGRLAIIRGWATTFDCIPGILGAVPYGILSDKWGRKPVMALSLIGFALSVAYICLVVWLPDVFPLWSIWFSSAFMLIGGSTSVAQAMLYTVVADVVPVAERATVFFQIVSTFLVASMIGSPLAGVLMRRSPWIALLTGLGLLVLSTITSFAVPETLHFNKPGDNLEAGSDQDDDLDTATLAHDPKDSELRKLITKAREDLAEIWKFIIGNKDIAFLLISIVFVVLGKFVQEMLLQYASKRFGWSWDEAAIFLTIHGAGNLVVLIVLLPAVSWLCMNYLKMSAPAKDLWLARISGIILVAGAVMIAFSANALVLSFALIIFAGGAGLTSLLRSLMNSLVEAHHVGTLNSLIGFMENVGLMIAGPTLSEALRIGIELGGPWIGLPFLCAALLFSVSTAVVWAFRMPGRGQSA